MGGKRTLARSGNYRLSARLNAARQIASTKLRQNPLDNNAPRHLVSYCPFQPVTDGNSYLPLIGRDEQYDAVVVAFTAYAPAVGQVAREVGYILSAEAPNCDNNHLVFSSQLELFQLARESEPLLSREDICHIGDSADESHGRRTRSRNSSRWSGTRLLR